MRKEPKKREKNYEKPLKINGTFLQAVKTLVKEPKEKK